MAVGIKRQLNIARKNVEKEISDYHDSANVYGRGLASEGYNGGYLDALSDVELALNGVEPSRRGWWREEQK